MNQKLTLTASRRGGWFYRQDAIDAGYSNADLRTRVRQGRWTRLCHGAYTELDLTSEASDPWELPAELHVRKAKAVYHRLGGRAVLSHQSALLLHGIRVSGLDLSYVHVTRRAGPGRCRAGITHHAAEPPVTEPVTVHDVQLTPGPRAVVEAARFADYANAVAAVDAALHRGLATPPELAEALKLFPGRCGTRTAAVAVAFGDGRAESVGESRLRILLADLGLPTPVLQEEIRDSSGCLAGRVDFLLKPWGVVIEFDGELKYGGADGVQKVVSEKWREDRLRDLGYEVVRISWDDLDHPARVAARINHAIARARRRAA